MGATAPSSCARRIVLTAVAIVLTLFTAEYALRFLAPPLWMVWEPNQHRLFRPDPEIMPGIHDESRFITDKLGYRSNGGSENAELRVLAVGGSTTECLYLDQEETWPHLLQEELAARTGRRVWVANGGKSGLNAYHHLVQVERLLDQPPEFDLVVLFVGLNDMHQRIRKGADTAAFDAWHRTHSAEVESRALAVHPDPYEWAGFPGRTAIATLITDAWRAVGSHREHQPNDIRVEDDHGQSYVRRREMRARAETWLDTPPDLSAALDAYAANLEQILDVTRSAGSQTLVVTQPSLWAPSMAPDADRLLWFGWFEDEPWVPKGYYTSGALARAMDGYNATTLRVADSRGVRALDLASHVARSPIYFYDDCHFTEAGAHHVADLMVEAVASHDLIRRPRSP